MCDALDQPRASILPLEGRVKGMGGKERGEGREEPPALPAPPNNQNKSKLFLPFPFPR